LLQFIHFLKVITKKSKTQKEKKNEKKIAPTGGRTAEAPNRWNNKGNANNYTTSAKLLEFILK